jgi:uncharacterized membrane protein
VKKKNREFKKEYFTVFFNMEFPNKILLDIEMWNLPCYFNVCLLVVQKRKVLHLLFIRERERERERQCFYLTKIGKFLPSGHSFCKNPPTPMPHDIPMFLVM